MQPREHFSRSTGSGRTSRISGHWLHFPDTFINSLVVAGGSTLIAIVCGIPAAYALARMKFKGKKIFLGIVIISQMFAPVVLLVGIYKIMSTFGMTDSLVGLVFINAAFNQAFAIWLLRGTFISISPEMEQAATVDGCGKVSALIRILLPVAAPGIVTALIFVFINAWNEYTVALTLISTDVFKPLTVGITIFNGYNMVEWQYLFASSLFATVPVIILFIRDRETSCRWSYLRWCQRADIYTTKSFGTCSQSSEAFLFVIFNIIYIF